MQDIHDLVIIGAGPAALTAAVYAGRAGVRPLLIERQLIGGQVATIDRIDNYPGLPGVAGLTLAQTMEQQARQFGAEIKFGTVTELERRDKLIALTTDNGNVVARSVLIATGAGYRRLNIPGESECAHYCATCDGAFYKGKTLITVGGANSAVQEVLFLSGLASHIIMLVRSYIKADQILKDQLNQLVKAGKVTLMEGWRPVRVTYTDGHIVRADITNGQSEQTIDGDGLFVFAGHIPNAHFLRESAVKLNDQGYIITDNQLMTTIPGVWAAGDVRAGAVRQIINAAADGSWAIAGINKYLNEAK